MLTRKIFIPIFLILISYSGFSQVTFKGKVIDVDSKEAISFASIWIVNTQLGCITQLNGGFSIKVPKPTDTVMVTAIGYKDFRIVGRNIPKDTLLIQLVPDAYQMDALIIKPGKNPAIPIVKTAIDNRRDNKPTGIKNIEFIEYNKLNLNISNLDSSIANSDFVKKHPEILIKTNDYDETWSVPLYFSERLTYQKRSENATPEVQEIVQNQVGSSFINSDITTKYISSLNSDMTFYGNLRFLSKDFISPISTQAMVYYKYQLLDSLEEGNSMYYRIKFKPRNPQDLAFYGHMIIEKNTGVLAEIDANLQQSANLNYVKSIRLSEKLQKTDNKEWFYKQQKMQVEFTPQLSQDTTNNMLNTPIFAIKTTSYIIDSTQIKNYLQNKIIPPKFNIARKQVQQDTSILNQYRPDTLSSLDIVTKGAIEITNEIPTIKATNKMLDMLLYGYYQVGMVDFGPYLYFVQANEIEKIRYNLAARTSPKFSKSVLLGGYVGYGTKDKKFKYGGTFSVKMPTKQFGALHATYDQNIYRIGDFKQNLNFVRENALVQSDDNILTALLTQSPNKAVYFVKKGVVSYEQQITPNIIIKPTYGYSIHYNPPFFNFNDSIVPSFELHEFGTNIRISFKEEISNNHFRNIYIDSRYPVINLNVLEGKYIINNKTDWYTQLRLVTRQDILIGIGRMKYVIETGITTKPVPFPLLEFHRGNETGGSGEYYFNHMKYMEFASDRFVNVFAEYGMNGFFLNKVWGIKKLNLRELITFKACYGQLSNKNADIFKLPTNTYTLSKPYMEAGVGITNLFKVIRVEYIWRLNYLDHPGVDTGGLFFRFQFEF